MKEEGRLEDTPAHGAGGLRDGRGASHGRKPPADAQCVGFSLGSSWGTVNSQVGVFSCFRATGISF